ncbi:FAS1-like dehydratase domain-containing protein [Nocardia mexicana]|uniref:MaoC dehydratase-like protein n=1 Tax=Nocardia mexicana TaxID=279262 RepID=A0A370GNE4_9NOCA|nr:MaoC dehydratase-like protein [Nocardia mexicana]
MFEVGSENIREFADAIGERPNIHESGRLRAPTTFAIVAAMPAIREAISRCDVDIDFANVVHRSQQFTFARPIVAGDVLTTDAEITGIETVGEKTIFAAVIHIRDAGGADVCTAKSTIVATTPAEARVA